MSDRKAQLVKASVKFRKTHKVYTFHLNSDQDKEVIKWLEKQGNRSEAVRRILRLWVLGEMPLTVEKGYEEGGNE